MKTPYPIRNVTENGAKDIITFAPKKASETETIIQSIKTKPCIVTLTNCNAKQAQRIIDILLGASVALNVKICVLDNENYLFTKE